MVHSLDLLAIFRFFYFLYICFLCILIDLSLDYEGRCSLQGGGD